MGIQIYANIDAVGLEFGRVQSATDLRPKPFRQFPVADSTTVDLYLTGQNGTLNIQDYPTVQLGVGALSARPSAGTWKMLVGAETSIDFDASAAALETVISSDINACTVSLLAPYVYKVKFDSVGVQSIPSVDASNLSPNSSANISTFVVGDATTQEEWLIRLFQNPLALTNSWTNTIDGGLRGNLSLGTTGIYELLGSNSSAKSTLELELTDSNGNISTIFQVEINITGEVIGQGATGVAAFGSYATSTELSAVAATAAADTAAALATAEASIATNYANTPHNTDAVIICNQDDDLQVKYGEASLLTPNGSPRSATNRASLFVMTGTYGDLIIDSSYVDVIGIGSPTLGAVGSTTSVDWVSNFKNFQCSSFSIVEFGDENYIENLTVTGQLSIDYNYGSVKNCRIGNFYCLQQSGTIKNILIVTAGLDIDDTNFGTIDDVKIRSGNFNAEINSGTIKNSSAINFLVSCHNYGIVDNCKSTSSTGGRSFGGSSSGGNLGTIRNCSSKSAGSFGGQSSAGLTENCIGTNQAFAANSNFIDWGYDNTNLGVAGTFKNCKGGNNSFFGVNLDSVNQRTIEAEFIDCTAGDQSFGWCVTAGAVTNWSGYASNCIAGEKSFCAAAVGAGTSKIETGGIIENCAAGAFSFGSFNNSSNEGFVLRCRTLGIGATEFDSTNTGKVRLCLDGNYDVINIPATAWPI